MPSKEFLKICANPHCGLEFFTRDKRKKFHNRSCAAKFVQKDRGPLSAEHKKNLSESIKRKYKEDAEYKKRIRSSIIEFYIENPESRPDPETCRRNAILGSKGKYKSEPPKSIFDVSKRTRSKIVRRLNLGCSRCKWSEGLCDIHHIRGKKICDPHNHNNLCMLCPNCHRLFHEGKILKEELITLADYFPKDWYENYYG